MNRQLSGAPRVPFLARALDRAAVAAATTALFAVGLVHTTPDKAPPISAETLVTTSTSLTAADTYELRVQRWVNVRRANHDLRRLRFAACPDRTAERWSRHLALNGALYHQSMTRVLDTCNARYAGETLGRGTMSPRKLVRMWMESRTHRAILLSKKPRRIGVGAKRDLHGRWVVAANFVRF